MLQGEYKTKKSLSQHIFLENNLEYRRKQYLCSLNYPNSIAMTKRIQTLLLLLVVGILSISAQAVITFKQTEHNFGKFVEDKQQSYVFKFKNTGDKPLVIEQATASCGCTIPTYTQAPIAPGKSGEIKVVYNGKGKFPGEFKKMITVRSNASNELVRLYILGNMEASKAGK